jgi:hypothetical protein
LGWTDPAGHVFAVGEVVTAATLNTYLKDDLLYLYAQALGSETAWSTWTPAVTATSVSPTLGTGPVQDGRYRQLGKLVIARATLKFGTSPTAGTGQYQVSLPVTARNAITSSRIGTADLFDSSAGATWVGFATINGTDGTKATIYGASAANGSAQSAVGAAVPWVWAASDEIHLGLFYEAA